MAQIVNAALGVNKVHGAFGGTYTALQECKHARSNLDKAESAIKLEQSVAGLFQAVVALPAYLGYIGTQITDLATTVFKHITPYLAHLHIITVLGAVGAVTATLAAVKESIALARQIYFLLKFQTDKWKINPVKELNNIRVTHPEAFKRSLPDWLFEKLEGPKKEKDPILDRLFSDAPHLRPKEKPYNCGLTPKEQVALVESYVFKKAVYHALVVSASLMAGVAALATGGISILVGVAIATAIAIAYAIVVYLYKECVLNNPDGGFSIKYAIPKVVRDLPEKISELVEPLIDHIEYKRRQREQYNALLATLLQKN
jgi:hypothetical protein